MEDIKQIIARLKAKETAIKGPGRKLTDAQVREIRSRLRSGEGVREVGRLYGLDPKGIRMIRDGKQYKDVKEIRKIGRVIPTSTDDQDDAHPRLRCPL
jgi:hypothetical protein